jgi:hypothetical protein
VVLCVLVMGVMGDVYYMNVSMPANNWITSFSRSDFISVNGSLYIQFQTDAYSDLLLTLLSATSYPSIPNDLQFSTDTEFTPVYQFRLGINNNSQSTISYAGIDCTSNTSVFTPNTLVDVWISYVYLTATLSFGVSPTLFANTIMEVVIQSSSSIFPVKYFSFSTGSTPANVYSIRFGEFYQRNSYTPSPSNLSYGCMNASYLPCNFPTTFNNATGQVDNINYLNAGDQYGWMLFPQLSSQLHTLDLSEIAVISADFKFNGHNPSVPQAQQDGNGVSITIGGNSTCTSPINSTFPKALETGFSDTVAFSFSTRGAGTQYSGIRFGVKNKGQWLQYKSGFNVANAVWNNFYSYQFVIGPADSVLLTRNIYGQVPTGSLYSYGKINTSDLQLRSDQCVHVGAGGTGGATQYTAIRNLGVSLYTLVSACPPGKYINSSLSPLASGYCTMCPSGLYSPGYYSTTCLPCYSSHYIAGTSCESCLPGSFQPLNGTTSCNLCSAGTYSAGNSTFCSDCSSGKFSSVNSSNCLDCSPGFFASSNQSASCSPCSSGFFAENPATLACEPCNSGKFANSSNSTACTHCLPATYSNLTAVSSCSSCPDNSFSQSGSRFSFECFCRTGSYGSPFLGEPCLSCPTQDDQMCPQNSTGPTIPSGKFWRPSAPAEVSDCIPAEACPESKSSQGTQCNSLYTGYLCGNCIYLTSYRSNGYCKNCPGRLSQVLTILLIVIVFVYLALRFSRGASKIPVDVKLAIASIQMIALYPNFFSKWPINLKNFFDVLSFMVSFNGFSSSILFFCFVSEL